MKENKKIADHIRQKTRIRFRKKKDFLRKKYRKDRDWEAELGKVGQSA